MIDPALIAAAVAEAEAERQPQQTRLNPPGLNAMLDPEVEDQINRARDWYKPFFDLNQVFRDDAAEAEAEQQPKQCLHIDYNALRQALQERDRLMGEYALYRAGLLR